MSILDYFDAVQAKIEGLFQDEQGNEVECTAPPVVASDLENENVRAFLMAIRVCEGTAGPAGYQTLFGGKQFDGFAQHPNQRIPFTQTDGKQNFSTAAGAYQFLAPTWAGLQKSIGLQTFSPANQDRGAIELIRRVGALEDVKAGNFVEAIDRCATVWASLPASKYPQPKRTLEFARRAYLSNGGVIAE